MGRTGDWSEFIPPEKQQTVELAGKWKHGWIPLDATAISSKMKGKSGGKRWWDKGGSGGNRRAVGVPKSAGQTVGKKRIAQAREPKPGDMSSARTSKANDRDRLQRNQNEAAGINRNGKKTSVLNVGQVPGAKAQKRKTPKPRNEMLTVKKVPAAKAETRDLKLPATADEELREALEPGMDRSAVHRSTSGSWAVDNGDGSWSIFDKQGRLRTDSASKNQLPADAWPSVRKTSTVGAKPVDVTQKRLTGSGRVVRTLGSDADRLAANYVRMHGDDGARKKLAALKKVKTKDARKNELIAALERRLGSGKA